MKTELKLRPQIKKVLALKNKICQKSQFFIVQFIKLDHIISDCSDFNFLMAFLIECINSGEQNFNFDL